tara:strand:+ start:190 stop:516 length:327 start_codon:yes stop_codon:yes gene_type:complete
MASQFDKITSINSPGWDGVNSNVEPFRKNINEQNDLDIAFSQCFQTKAGQIVLDYLKKKTIDQPAWVPGAEPSFGYAREGQNSIIREINQRMERNYGRSTSTSTTPRK